MNVSNELERSFDQSVHNGYILNIVIQENMDYEWVDRHTNEHEWLFMVYLYRT